MSDLSRNPSISGPDVELPYRVALRVLDEVTSPERLRESEGAGSGLIEFLDGLEDAGIGELSTEDAEAALEALAARYDYARPVLEDWEGDLYRTLGTDRPWKIASGIMLKEMQRGHVDPDVLTPFLRTPVSESLSGEAVRATAGNQVVGRMLGRYPWLSEYVALPEVPDDRIGSTLHQYQYTKLVRPTDITDKHTVDVRVDAGPGSILSAKETLDGLAERGRFHEGITPSERRLVLLRSVFGRDVKLLALGAELLQNPDVQFDGQNTLTLPSGTTVSAVPGQKQKALDLLRADQWRGRTQIHDRVHEVTTETGEYVLKECKTPRHASRWDKSTISPSSQDEVAIATEFMQRGAVHEGNVSAAWERPVGSAKDPSGFEFAIFEYEADLVSFREISKTLSEAIKQSPQLYQAEFDAVRASIEGGVEVSWDDFAKAKAHLMEQHADLLLRKTMLEAGYVDGYKEAGGVQIADHAYRIHKSDSGLRLEIVGFDFEYFVKLAPDALQRCKEQFNFVIDNRTHIHEELGWVGPPKSVGEAVKGIVKYAQANDKSVLPEKFE